MRFCLYFYIIMSSQCVQNILQMAIDKIQFTTCPTGSHHHIYFSFFIILSQVIVFKLFTGSKNKTAVWCQQVIDLHFSIFKSCNRFPVFRICLYIKLRT